jgi:hypothetical protein
MRGMLHNLFTRSWLPRRRGYASRRKTRLLSRPSAEYLSLEILEDRTLLDIRLTGAPTWMAQGPDPITGGQVEGLGDQNNPVAGAVSSIAVNPNNANDIYLGTVNGGIWSTHGGTPPTWDHKTDQFASLAISAIAYGPTTSSDWRNHTIYAGTGNVSSARSGGKAIGLLKTTNGGDTWSLIGRSTFEGLRISKIVPTTLRSNRVIFVATDQAEMGRSGVGVYRSINGGLDWEHPLPGTNGLPDAGVSDLVADPSNPNRFYAAIPGQGVYRSSDGGNHWEPVNMGLTGVATSARIELAVHYNAAGPTNALYAGLIDTTTRELAGLFRSDNAGDHWVAMDLPRLLDGNFRITGASTAAPIVITSNNHGLQTGDRVRINGVTGLMGANGDWRVTRLNDNTFSLQGSMGTGTYSGSGTWGKITGLHPGRSGTTVFSLAADPVDANVVYVGGDRQDLAMSPNSIGAQEDSGRLFRGDARIAPNPMAIPSPQWLPITHNGTFNNSAPHADSRALAFDRNGNLLEADDGGIYRLINPRGLPSARSWESLNGNLQITEIYSLAYDSVNHVLMGGAQDVGTAEQLMPDNSVWHEVQEGDGSFQAVDTSGPNTVRYSLGKNFRSFRRRRFNNANVELNPAFVRVPVSDATNMNPITIRSANHGLVTGDRVLIRGVKGNTAANGSWRVTRLTNDTFSLDTAMGNGTYMGGGIWRRAGDITNVTGAAGAEVVITSPNHHLSTGDQVEILLNRDTALDGNNYSITRLGPDQFKLNGTAADGTMMGTGFWFRSDVVPLKRGIGRSNLSGLNSLDRGLPDFDFQRIPFVLNTVTPTRLVIGFNGLYESMNRGDTITEINDGAGAMPPKVSALAYGGRNRDGSPNPDVLYVARGSQIGVRTTPHLHGRGGTFTHVTLPGAGIIQAIKLDPSNWRIAYATDGIHVYMTQDGGATNPVWQDITGSLHTDNVATIEVINVPAPPHTVLLVGGTDGVFRTLDPDPAHVSVAWIKFGAGLPHAPVSDLHYDSANDLLLAGTLGRGAWTIARARANVAANLVTDVVLQVSVPSGSSGMIRLIRNADNPLLLDVSVNAEQQTVELAPIQQILVTGADRTVLFTIDIANGVIAIPGEIQYRGGSGSNFLRLEGTTGTTISQVGPDATGAGSVQIRGDDGVQTVTFTHVQDLQNRVRRASGSRLRALRNGLALAADWSGGLNNSTALARGLPVVGQSLGRALNGMTVPGNPLADADSGAASENPLTGISTSAILRRIFEEGPNGLRLADIDTAITDPEALRQALARLSSGSVVTLWTGPDGSLRYDMRVTQTLSGMADLNFQATASADGSTDLRGAAGGSINLHGTLEVSARVDVHFIFGVDDTGFFIDAQDNPDPELTISHLQVSGDISGRGQIGFLEVTVDQGTLMVDPGVRLTVKLQQTGGGYLHLDDLGPVTDRLVSTRVERRMHGVEVNDVSFQGRFHVAALVPGFSDAISLADTSATLTWTDVTNLADVHLSGSGLLSFLNLSSSQIINGLSSAADTFQRIAGVNILGTQIPLINKTLGEILNSSVDFPNDAVASISGISTEGSFKKFTVTVADGVDLLRQGVVTGATVTYQGARSTRFTGLIDSVESSQFTVRFNQDLNQDPDTANPLFQITRGSLQNLLAGTLGGADNLADQAPTLQSLVRELAERMGFEIPETIRLDASGSMPTLQFTLDFSPAAIVFRQDLNFGAGIPGLSLQASGNFQFTISPQFHLTVGLRLDPGASLEQRFFIVPTGTEVSLHVSALLHDPVINGTIGFLNIELSPVTRPNDISLTGDVTVRLRDPGSSGRITLADLRSVDLTRLFTAGINARLNLPPLQVRAAVGSSTLAAMHIGLSMGRTSYDINSLMDLTNLPGQIEFSGVTSFLNFNNITPQMIIDMLVALVGQLQTLGAGGILNQPLPIINRSISQVLNIGQEVANRIDTRHPELLPVASLATAQGLANFLDTHVCPDRDPRDPPCVTVAVNSDDIRFTLNLTVGISQMLPIAFDVGGLIHIDAGRLNLAGTATLHLTVGLTTSAGFALLDRLFLGAGRDESYARVDATLSAGYGMTGDASAFRVDVGPLHVVKGRVLIHPTIRADILDGGDSPPDGKLTFNEIVQNVTAGTWNNLLRFSFGGGIQAIIPLDVDGMDDVDLSRLPMVAAEDAVIVIAGKLENLFDNRGNLNITFVNYSPPMSDPVRHHNPASNPLDEATEMDPTHFYVVAYNLENAILNRLNFDFSGLFGTLSSLNTLLRNIKAGLDSGLLSNIPLVDPSSARQATQFISQIVDKVAMLTRAANPSEIQRALFSVLGRGRDAPSGLGLLRDRMNNPSEDFNDITITQDAAHHDYVEFTMHLHNDFSPERPWSLNASLGIPGLGLTLGGNLAASLSFDLYFGFGISRTDGIYLVFRPPTGVAPLTVSVTITPNVSAEGQLGFLKLAVSPAAMGLNEMRGDFTVNVRNANPNGRVTLQQVTTGNLNLDARFTGHIYVNLGIVAGFGDNSGFPSVQSNFQFTWNFNSAQTGTGLFGDAPVIRFNQIQLNLGSFFSDFVRPILVKVQEVTRPLEPIKDILTARLPILSDFQPAIDLLNPGSGHTSVTLLDVAHVLDPDLDTGLIDTLFGVIDFIKRIPTNDPMHPITIDLGSFTLGSTDVRTVRDLQGVTPSTTPPTDSVERQLGRVPDNYQAALAVVRAPGNRLQFPLLQNPAKAFDLLLGKSVSLFTFDPGILRLNFRMGLSFPILGPLALTLSGGLSVQAHFMFGYDTRGLQDFVSDLNSSEAWRRTPGHLAEDILNGFYVSTRANADGTGDRVPQVSLTGTIQAFASLDLGIAAGGVGGGITATVGLELCDPGGDGKLRGRQIAQAVRLGRIDGIVSLHGELSATLNAYVRFLFYTQTLDIATVRLLSFNTPCAPLTDDPPPPAPPPLADFDRASGELRLRVASGNARLQVSHSGGIPGSPERITLQNLDDPTRRETYDSVQAIVAEAGPGNHAITIDSGVYVPVNFRGRDGDNKIINNGSGMATYTSNGGTNHIMHHGNGTVMFQGRLGTTTITDDGTGDATLTGGGGNNTFTNTSASKTYTVNEDGDNDYALAPDPTDRTGATYVLGIGSAGSDTLRGRFIVNLHGSSRGSRFTVSNWNGTTNLSGSGDNVYVVNTGGGATVNIMPADPLGHDQLTINGSRGNTFAIGRTRTAVGADQVFYPSYLNSLAVNLVGAGSGTTTFGIDDTPDGTTVGNLGDAPAAVNVRAAHGPTIVNGGAGTGTIVVGSLAPAISGGIVDGLRGLVTLHGGGRTTLSVDDSGSRTIEHGVLTATTLTGLGMGDGLRYDGIMTLNIGLGSAGNRFTIASTHRDTTTVDTGPGDDLVFVRTTSGPTTVNTGPGRNTVIVGLRPWPEPENAWEPLQPPMGPRGGIVDGIQGPLVVNGLTQAFTALFVDDAGSRTDKSGNLKPMTLTGLGMGPQGITYGPRADVRVQSLTIYLGAGTNAFTVVDTHAGATTVETGSGNNTVDVLATTGVLTVNAPVAGKTVVNVSSADKNLNTIQGTVTVNGRGGDHVLNVYDSSGPIGGLTYTLAGNAVTRPGAAMIVYNNVKGVVVYGSNGSNTYNVTDTEGGGFDPLTTLNTGTGADTVYVLATTGRLAIIASGSANDTVIISPAAHNLTAIQGKVSVNGNAGETTFLVFDQGGPTTGLIYTLTGGAVDRTGANTISYAAVKIISVYGSNGANVYNVTGTAGGPLAPLTTLFTGTGNDLINVHATTGRLSVNLGNSFDVVVVSPSAHNLDALQGDVTINGTGTANTLTVYDQNAPAGTLAYTLTGGSLTRSATAIIRYNGAKNITIYGANGSATFTVSGTAGGPLDPLTTLNTGSGTNAVDVSVTSGRLLIGAGGGPLTVSISPAFQTLDPIQGAVTVAGNGAASRLVINDQAGSGANLTYTLGRNSVSRPGAATIAYIGVGAVTLHGSRANDTYNVTDTEGGLFDPLTTVDTGFGAATVNVLATTGRLAVSAGSAPLTVNVSPTARNLSAIQGSSTFVGAGAGSALTLYDQNATAGRLTYSVTAGSVTRTGSAMIAFSAIPSVTLHGSNAGNTYLVADTAANSTTVINGGSGGNTFTVQGTGANSVTTINAGTGGNSILVGGTDGTINNLRGDLSVIGPGFLTITDANNTPSDTRLYTITASSVRRTGPPVPVGIITYRSVQGLVVNASTGANAVGTGVNAVGSGVSVLGTAAGVDTTVNAGPGQAVVTVGDLDNPLDGIQGPLHINGLGSPNVLLSVDDEAHGTAGLTYTLTATSMDRTGMATLTYGNCLVVSLTGGAGGNTFVVTSAAGATDTVLNSSDPADTILVRGSSAMGNLDINLLNGGGTVIVGNGGLLDGIANVAINDSTGTTTVIADDSSFGGGEVYTIQNDTVEDVLSVGRLANPVVGYQGVGSFILYGGTGADTFAIDSTSVATTVNAGPGGNTFDLSPFSQWLGASLAGPLTLLGGGSDVLQFFDVANPGAETFTFDFDDIPSSLTLATAPDFACTWAGMATVILFTNGSSTVDDPSGMVVIDPPMPPSGPDTWSGNFPVPSPAGGDHVRSAYPERDREPKDLVITAPWVTNDMVTGLVEWVARKVRHNEGSREADEVWLGETESWLLLAQRPTR